MNSTPSPSDKNEMKSIVKKDKETTYTFSFSLNESSLDLTLIIEDSDVKLYKCNVSSELLKEKNKCLFDFDDEDIFEILYHCFQEQKFEIDISKGCTFILDIVTSIKIGIKEKQLTFSLTFDKEKDEKKLAQLSSFKMVKLSSELKELREIITKKGDEALSTKFNEFVDGMEIKYNDHVAKVEGILKSNKIETDKNFEVLRMKYEELQKGFDLIKSIGFVNRYSSNKLCPLYLSSRTTLKILHITNSDCYSPVASVLITEASKAGVTLQITDFRGNSAYTDYLKHNYDAILVTTWSSINQEDQGNFLFDYIMAGGNVVINLFANSTNYTFPKGRFTDIQPFIPGADGSENTIDMVKIDNNHPIFNGYSTITQGSDKRISNFTINYEKTQCDLLATRNGGKPFIVTRRDLPGIITCLGFQCGSVGSQDGLKIVVNALRLSKY